MLEKEVEEKNFRDALRSKVVHLVLDFRMDYVEKHLKELQREISLASSDMDRMMKLMAEYKDMLNIRNSIAKELGNEIIA